MALVPSLEFVIIILLCRFFVTNFNFLCTGTFDITKLYLCRGSRVVKELESHASAPGSIPARGRLSAHSTVNE